MITGMTYDGTNLIVSDGSSFLTTFAVPGIDDKRLQKVITYFSSDLSALRTKQLAPHNMIALSDFFRSSQISFERRNFHRID